jgi:hypothetical protein
MQEAIQVLGELISESLDSLISSTGIIYPSLIPSRRANVLDLLWHLRKPIESIGSVYNVKRVIRE